MKFCDRYSSTFVGQGFNSGHHARDYLSGLTGTQRRKNIETIENDVAGSNYQGMEQFISSSPWSHRELLDKVARGADEEFGDAQEASLSIDESGMLKKGHASVGVKRQWCGRAGKVENCQIGVYASLGCEERYSLIDFELFLPEEWADDPARCDKAKIPEDKREHKAKWELGLEMVARARENKVRFGWVGVDSLYGHNNQFLNTLEDRGEKFIADVRKSYKIWTSKPALKVPIKKPGQPGKTPTCPKLDKEKNKARYLDVEAFVAENFDKKHQVLEYRQGTKGKLCARVWVQDIWVWEQRWKGAPRKRRLIVRQDESGDFKYSLTNLPDPKDWQKDLYKQNQRFWIEQSFHEAKSQTGMAQYQVRVWQGWHHHMALVCLATLFMDQAKHLHKASHPLLSYRDITELLDYYLPRRHRDEAEVHAQIRKRHAKRQEDLDRRRDKRTGIPPDIDLTK
jgi:SRSO17 transposase